MRKLVSGSGLLVAFAGVAAFSWSPAPVQAQAHVHTEGMTHEGAGMSMVASGMPAETMSGQAAFAAISAVVKVLEGDPGTDWSRVDLEGLRQHLIDMDLVVLQARVSREDVPGGATFEIRGEGAVAEAIRRMTLAHAQQLQGMPNLSAVAVTTETGALLTVKALDGSDWEASRIRGLGFIGLLALGDHHGPHHLALARGLTPRGH